MTSFEPKLLLWTNAEFLAKEDHGMQEAHYKSYDTKSQLFPIRMGSRTKI